MEPQQMAPQQPLLVRYMVRSLVRNSEPDRSSNDLVSYRSVKGFSALELLFSMSLVFLLFCITMPPIREVLQGYLFSEEINQIAEDIRDTRLHAVTNTIWCRLEFFSNAPVYSIYYGSQLQKTRSFPKSLHYLGDWLSFPAYRLSFDGTGGPSAAGTFRFVDVYGHHASVIVYLGTGLVAVRD